MRRQFVATCADGLDLQSFPYKLFQKAKRMGSWNPEDIDYRQDQKDWQQMTSAQQAELRGRLAAFVAGEEAVTTDLLPLIMTIAKQGRLEEELYLTTFLLDEAKHTEFFRLLLNALGETEDVSRYHHPAIQKIFHEMLPETMNRLLCDSSPAALADASTLYNMFVEGVLAETGYFIFYESLKKSGRMPGLTEGIGYLKSDESRHISYGTYLLQRLIAEDPSLFDRIVKKMDDLMPLAMEIFTNNGYERSPLGISAAKIKAYAVKQHKVRIDILARAKTDPLEEIVKKLMDEK
ncbi:R2-like ligand-binding oxidase [Thermoactinomyces sp. AMNI-1]|uniref:R2-like ligand binding oxidase n=1 Tax=Thermoactinomyces mirandus TaxID=2756294 RepID=A0A7W2ARL4_9BACL|nr:R2-like ligand-binding oxidase [Thermoactinomyces mirandus]